MMGQTFGPPQYRGISMGGDGETLETIRALIVMPAVRVGESDGQVALVPLGVDHAARSRGSSLLRFAGMMAPYRRMVHEGVRHE